MSSGSFRAFVVFLILVGLVLAPYLRFVVQRQGLYNDLARISLDFSTLGRAEFEGRVDQICRNARLKPGSYQVEISQDRKSKVVSVEIRYEAEFTILFVPQKKNVVVRKVFDALDI